MSFGFRNSLGLISLLLALSVAMSAKAADFLLVGGGCGPPACSGGNFQIGTGLPLPAAPIFLGGMAAGTAGTPFWPPLGIPPGPGASTAPTTGRTKLISQNLATGLGGTMVVPPGVLSTPAAGVPVKVGVFPTNPAVFQVATTISFAWPAVTATLAPGGAPGPAVLGTPNAGGIITYGGGAKAFGGAGQFVVVPGPGAGGFRVPPNAMGAPPIATLWINFAGAGPTTVMTVLIVGASAPAGVGQPGAPTAAPSATTMFGPVSPGFGAVNAPVGGVGCTMWCVGPLGTIPSSLAVGGPAPSNMVTGSKGFPWTTGFITVSQPAAVPPEIFFLSGTDMRVAGVGNVSLVSGALSTRALSGPNANRGWLSLTLPEPSAALGSLGALAMLGLCHGLVRRRSR
jgi:hypothetical protein